MMTRKISTHLLLSCSVCCGIATALTAFTACSDWSDHYDETTVTTNQMQVYNGDVVSYLKSDKDLSSISTLFQETGVYGSTTPDRAYTFIVCDNSTFSQAAITDRQLFANYCVADVAVSPTLLTDGFGIRTRSGKNVWVYGEGDNLRLDDFHIKKQVKAANGYVYVIDGQLPIRQSVYDYLMALGDDYSLFKQFVADEEIVVFDEANSTPVGTNEAGMTVYDSVMVKNNTLMDRYTKEGILRWNMRDETFVTTMFIPNNAQIEKAMHSALDSIPSWLFRQPTAADTLKFRQWIVRACFSDRRIPVADVTPGAPIFPCVEGYQRIEDKQADRITYKAVEPAYWLPATQQVDTSPVNLSNGVAYFCKSLKIPNHIVIYRVKNRLYQVWNALEDEEKEEYFRWQNWALPTVIENVQSEFKLTDDPRWPTIYYHVLSAEPTPAAIRDSLVCSVEYDGLMYNEKRNAVRECQLPAGEYYLRMGFKHQLTYSLNIFFNGEQLVKDMVMSAVASNFHLDRSGASDIPRYGDLYAGYPEGYDPAEWLGVNENASAYDTDGYTVGIVTLKKNGNFRIKVSSADNAYRYPYATGEPRNTKNVAQLMMYHWCLRPTINNY